MTEKPSNSLENCQHRYNFYGRRSSNQLSKKRQNYVKKYLPLFTPKGISVEENPLRRPLNFESVYKRKCQIWMEIGYGSGEHLLELAKENPDICFLGCEPYKDGTAKFLAGILENKLENVRIYMDDARKIFDIVPLSSLSKVFLLFPDPWPKLRHRRRRFMNNENIDNVARMLKPGGHFYFSTDILEYFCTTLDLISQHVDFTVSTVNIDDCKYPWSGWVPTRYEQKAIRDGRQPLFAVFSRN